MDKYDKMPFNCGFGTAIGRGSDSVVVPLLKNDKSVLKWNHDLKEKEVNSEKHFNRLLYKKKKYELLFLFLRDFIPKSDFVLGNKLDGKKLKIKEYTRQDRVPNIKIASLMNEQKLDSKLLYNIHLLILKLRAMHKIVKQVNNSIKEGQLDVKLDLGGLSEIASKKEEEDKSNDIINEEFINSPNLLVDPETMRLSCIDFGSGEWSEAKEATLILLKTLVENDERIKELISRPQK